MQGGSCQDCGAPLERGQRYCVACGARAGSRSPQLLALLGARGGGGGRARGADLADAVSGSGAERRGRSYRPRSVLSSIGAVLADGASSLTLPSRKVCTLLVLGFLGFGVLLGEEATPPSPYSLAASARPRVELVIPRTGNAGASSAAGRESSSAESASKSEPPAASAEATPPASSSGTAKSSTRTSPASGSGSTSSAGEQESSSSSSESKGGGSSSKLPAIKHVFVIMLADEPFAAAFGPESSAPYLSRTLLRQGALLSRYYALAHEGLPDGIGLLSGQGPTVETAADCPTYGPLTPASSGQEGQLLGAGCVYPASTQTLLAQLAAKHLTWRAYVEGIDERGSSQPACAHPALGAPDPTAAQAALGEPYATARDPFVYFAAVTGSPACASNVVGLVRLASDLSSPKRTPNFAYIAPDNCHDGVPAPCAGGAPAGMAAADAYLKPLVSKILASKAYKESGLLVITVDQAPSKGAFADSSSCCDQPAFPNLPAPAVASLRPKGGGQVGALLLSPFIKGGTTSQEPYNDFSLLRTIEDLFSLPHLGYAASSKVASLEPSIFSARAG